MDIIERISADIFSGAQGSDLCTASAMPQLRSALAQRDVQNTLAHCTSTFDTLESPFLFISIYIVIFLFKSSLARFSFTTYRCLPCHFSLACLMYRVGAEESNVHAAWLCGQHACRSFEGWLVY